MIQTETSHCNECGVEDEVLTTSGRCQDCHRIVTLSSEVLNQIFKPNYLADVWARRAIFARKQRFVELYGWQPAF